MNPSAMLAIYSFSWTWPELFSVPWIPQLSEATTKALIFFSLDSVVLPTLLRVRVRLRLTEGIQEWVIRLSVSTMIRLKLLWASNWMLCSRECRLWRTSSQLWTERWRRRRSVWLRWRGTITTVSSSFSTWKPRQVEK